jgi:hypothetical protein
VTLSYYQSITGVSACLACTSPVGPSVHSIMEEAGPSPIASRRRRDTLDPITATDRHASTGRRPGCSCGGAPPGDRRDGRILRARGRAGRSTGFALLRGVLCCPYGRGRPAPQRTSATVLATLRSWFRQGRTRVQVRCYTLLSCVPVWCTFLPKTGALHS